MCLPKLKTWRRCTPEEQIWTPQMVAVSSDQFLGSAWGLCVQPEQQHHLLLQKATPAGWQRTGLRSWLFARDIRQCRHFCCKMKGCWSVYEGASQRESKASGSYTIPARNLSWQGNDQGEGSVQLLVLSTSSLLVPVAATVVGWFWWSLLKLLYKVKKEGPYFLWKKAKWAKNKAVILFLFKIYI